MSNHVINYVVIIMVLINAEGILALTYKMFM